MASLSTQTVSPPPPPPSPLPSSEVRKQTGAFQEAFADHEKNDLEKVQKWRETTKVSNPGGFHLNDWHESKVIQDIVQEISFKLRPPLPVGLRHRSSTRESNNNNSNHTILNVEEANGNDNQRAEDNNNDDRRHSRDGSNRKVILEWIFVMANLILELSSAVFDQLSSVQKPEYALIAMLFSLVAILLCVIELLRKGQKEGVVWRWKVRIPWFYYPSDKHFGTFADIVGLSCTIFQFIATTINYSFILRKANIPIKISVWPIIFTFGVFCSKFSEKPNKTLH